MFKGSGRPSNALLVRHPLFQVRTSNACVHNEVQWKMPRDRSAAKTRLSPPLDTIVSYDSFAVECRLFRWTFAVPKSGLLERVTARRVTHRLKLRNLQVVFVAVQHIKQ